MSKHLSFATNVLFVLFLSLGACRSVHAEKTETFDSAASAAANGWTAINDDVDLQSAGFIDENLAGGAAPGEAQYHVYRGMGLAYVDTNLGMTVNGHAAFSITGVLSNLGGVQPDPENPVVLSGDVGFPPILGFSSGPGDQIGILFRGDDPGALGETGAEVAWGLRFVRALNENEPFGNIIIGAGGDFSRILLEDVSYPFSLVYNPDDGEFGSVTAEVIGAGGPIVWPLNQDERNHLNEVAFNSAGLRKFDNGANARSNFELRLDDLTYTGVPGLPPVGVPGDYNGNMVVDAADYTIWRDNLGSTTAALPNDPSPTIVDAEDYNTWKTNFGMTSGPGGGSGSIALASAVPEPATALLAAMAACLVGVSRRRQWKASKK